ncbi:MAG TPA: pilus assembly protein PilM, partial [Solirubrobacteraceae bacterium]|nr:pilus assembly protein PilM [Solirubrobacteraceae bacterium]
MRLPAGIPQLNVNLPRLGRRSGGPNVVGLDIQPGFVAAVQARVNGSITAERAVSVALPADTVRDGEVHDEVALAEALRELFADSGLGKRVRIGVANQRTVLRTLELPPVTDEKELAAAVTFQAQDQVPMPLNNAVLDFHPLGIIDTPAGPRQRVVLVAAQRDMIERLLSAVRQAGLTPEGVDLSAFALIRSLYRNDPDQSARVLYLNVDGLTNLAIAEGTVCRFTRVVGSGLEGMATELAERRGIALADARELLAAVDLTVPAPVSEPLPVQEPVAAAATEPVADPEADAELSERAA